MIAKPTNWEMGNQLVKYNIELVYSRDFRLNRLAYTMITRVTFLLLHSEVVRSY